MTITLLTIGKTKTPSLAEGIAEYTRRLKRFTDFRVIEVPDVKHASSVSPKERSERECALILEKHLPQKQVVILLDEHGKEFTSTDFATWMKKRTSGGEELCFVVAGPYGASDALKARADATIALSQMTFSHEMVRLFFVEQLYRAFTINKGLPYHHE